MLDSYSESHPRIYATKPCGTHTLIIILDYIRAMARAPNNYAGSRETLDKAAVKAQICVSPQVVKALLRLQSLAVMSATGLDRSIQLCVCRCKTVRQLWPRWPSGKVLKIPITSQNAVGISHDPKSSAVTVNNGMTTPITHQSTRFLSGQILTLIRSFTIAGRKLKCPWDFVAGYAPSARG